MIPASRQELIDYWIPRYYYILRNRVSGKLYIGQTKTNICKYLGSGSYWTAHCKKYGGYNRANIELVHYWWFDDIEFAEFFLEEFEMKEGQYWCYSNTKWANLVREDTLDNPFFANGSAIATKNNYARVNDGSHPFIKENITESIVKTQFTSELAKFYNNVMIANKTHPLLKDNETETMRIRRKTQLIGMTQYQLDTGTHMSQNAETIKRVGEQNRIHNNKRVESGEHQFLNSLYAVNKNGEIVKITIEQYKSQIGEKDSWEFVHPVSKEAKRRRAQHND